MGKSGELSADRDAENLRRDDDLLFAWGKRPRLIVHFGFFLLGSFLVHALGFYLFQVKYPDAAILAPTPDRVTLLDETRPAVNGLLREVGDRLVYVSPASSGAGSRAELKDFSVRFEPSFAGRELQFQPLPEDGVREELSGKKDHPESRVVLPPIDSGRAAEKPPAGGPAEPRWRLSGGLEDRGVPDPRQFEKALPELKSPPEINLWIGVGPEGSVRFLLPRAGEARPDFDAVAGAVKQHLKFAPRPGSGIAWGSLVIDR